MKAIGGNIIILMIVAVFLSCAVSPSSTPPAQTPQPNGLSETISSLVPDGWKLSEPVSVFTPETLYEKINGNAELYLAYNVVTLTFATFIHADNSGEFIDVFVYDMATPTNGFGIYSVERFEGEPPVNLGRAGYHSRANYFIWKGQYYIQIVASGAGDTLREIGRDLAEKTTHALTDTGEPVWGLSALPEKDRIDDSIKFFLVDAMGLDFMKRTYTADYDRNGIRVRAFVSQQPSPEAARSTITQYRAYAGRYGDGVESETVDGIEILTCDMKSGYDIVFRKGSLAAGVLSVKDRSLAVKAATDLWKQLDIESE
ncbi:MAG: DUF6599 family protein [Desulfobacterales bacterium]